MQERTHPVRLIPPKPHVGAQWGLSLVIKIERNHIFLILNAIPLILLTDDIPIVAYRDSRTTPLDNPFLHVIVSSFLKKNKSGA